MKHFGLMTPRSVSTGTTPPTLTLLTANGIGGTPYVSPSIAPTAGSLILVLSGYRRTPATVELPGQSSVDNSGALLPWTVRADVSQDGTNPATIRQTLFSAVAPGRALTITVNSPNQAQGHVCILQLDNALASFGNTGYDTSATGDLVLALPTASLANSLTLAGSSAASNDGASASVFGSIAGWTTLYNGFKRATADGNNPISMWVAYKQHDDALNFNTAGLNTVGSFTELKHA
jgi:hypothetical protein